jgi:tetratricopeptide (TPR) repeat protein
MELKLKPIHVEGIVAALAKAELYRNLNEPEEAESICHDILAIQPNNQAALRLIGLAITDQFTGGVFDRHGEVENIFRKLSDSYEQLYCIGLLYERRAKAQMRAGRPAQALVPLFQEAMRHFAEAEKIRPAENDESILRWNRCVRLLQALPGVEQLDELQISTLDTGDSPPVSTSATQRRARAG